MPGIHMRWQRAGKAVFLNNGSNGTTKLKVSYGIYEKMKDRNGR